MSCCGQKRAATVQAYAQRPSLAIPLPTAMPQAASAGSSLRYAGATPLSLRGPFSGRSYYFAAAGHSATVDAGDAEALLRTGLFVRTSN